MFSRTELCYVLGLLKDERVSIEDQLVDVNNQPVEATVNFEVRYVSPENKDGSFEASNVSKSLQQQQSSLDEEQKILLDIEQNIANLERNITQGEFSCKHIHMFKLFLKYFSS